MSEGNVNDAAFYYDELNRRHWLQQTALGIGSFALSELLADDVLLADGSGATGAPHHTPRAKNVIFLFMAGAPSQFDLFTPKPKMKELHGKPVPASFLDGLDDALIKGSARVFASPRKFKRYGAAGMHFSDYLPHMAKCADEFSMIRSVTSDVSNHHPAQLMMNCGVPHFGLPSMGSWVSYGLGAETKDLPSFIVMLSKNGSGDLGGQALWDNAFLPATNRGVTFRANGDPILHLSNPKGVKSASQRRRIAALNDLNRMRQTTQTDPEIANRIKAYELAHRMQAAGPELVDFSKESKQTLESYGIGSEKSDAFGKNCLMARRAVERGVRFVQLYHYTWDDHSHLNKKLKDNCERTEQGVAGLIQDLKQRGLLDSTLVVWGGEFGRTPMNEVRRGINPGKEGRDHHPFSFTMLMAGGGVKPGFVYGDTDDLGYHATDNPVHVHDLQATILHCLGLDHLKLTYRYRGRDFRLTDVGGEVLDDILV